MICILSNTPIVTITLYTVRLVLMLSIHQLTNVLVGILKKSDSDAIKKAMEGVNVSFLFSVKNLHD